MRSLLCIALVTIILISGCIGQQTQNGNGAESTVPNGAADQTSPATYQSVADCELMSDTYQRETCFSNVAVNVVRNDPSICDKIEELQWMKDSCYGATGAAIGDTTVCDRAPQKNICYTYYAFASGDANVCNLIVDDTSQKSQCSSQMQNMYP